MNAPQLHELEELARQAGALLQSGFGSDIQVRHKGSIDLVTEMDHRSEAFLLERIQTRYPTHQIIAEESGLRAGSQEQVWHIDPLDGTVNYAHGIPIFAVSIAYQEAGELLLGVVYDPMRDECYTAERGRGAWLNGQRLKVSATAELDKSLLVTGFAYDIRVNPNNNLDHYAAFALRSQGVRRLGSAAIDLGYVAAGRFDGYWELSIETYDIAAGALLVQEAGGLVSDVRGGPDFLRQPPSIVAANPAVHAQMLEILNGKTPASI